MYLKSIFQSTENQLQMKITQTISTIREIYWAIYYNRNKKYQNKWSVYTMMAQCTYTYSVLEAKDHKNIIQ